MKTKTRSVRSVPVPWTEDEKAIATALMERHSDNGQVLTAALDADPERAKIPRPTKDIKQWYFWHKRYKQKHGFNGDSRKAWTDEQVALLAGLTQKHRQQGKYSQIDWRAIAADPSAKPLFKTRAIQSVRAYWQRMGKHKNGHVKVVEPMQQLRPVTPVKRTAKRTLGALAYMAWVHSVRPGHSDRWEDVSEPEQIAWQAAAEAVQPEPAAEKASPNFCPGCGFKLQSITLAMNLPV